LRREDITPIKKLDLDKVQKEGERAFLHFNKIGEKEKREEILYLLFHTLHLDEISKGGVFLS
jgi:hypothetical protein